MKTIATTLLTASAALAMAQSVSVNIHRVRQVDDLDKSTWLITKDRADFYAQIWINGRMWQSKNFSHDDGRPNWSFTVPADSRYVDIRIKLVDDDGGLEEKDDYVDINPLNDKKDLELRLDRQTGLLSGDIVGRRGQIIRSKGMYDSSQGEIWFSIE